MTDNYTPTRISHVRFKVNYRNLKQMRRTELFENLKVNSSREIVDKDRSE